MAENESNSKDNKFVKKLDFSSSTVSAQWKVFKSQFNIFKVAKKYKELSQEEQICNMLVQMGQDSVPIYEQFTFDEGHEDTKQTLANTIKFFDNYFEPVRNLMFERVKFNSIRQGELSIHQFIVKVQHQAEYCDYGAIKADLIRDRIVVGVRDQKLREYLIDIEDLDLPKCIQKAKQYTSNHSQAMQFSGATGGDNIDGINTKFGSQEGKAKRSGGGWDKPTRDNPCEFCGKNFHRGKTCPAKDAECRRCHEKGHWANSKSCKEKKSKQTKEVHTVKSPEEVEEDKLEGLYLGQTV